MKTKYFLFSNNDFTCYWSSDNLKDIIDKYYYELNYIRKNYWSYDYNEFSIARFLYDPKRIEIDYGMDREVYCLDLENDCLIDYDDFDEYWIKQNEIKKDFLYHKNK